MASIACPHCGATNEAGGLFCVECPGSLSALEMALIKARDFHGYQVFERYAGGDSGDSIAYFASSKSQPQMIFVLRDTSLPGTNGISLRQEVEKIKRLYPDSKLVGVREGHCYTAQPFIEERAWEPCINPECGQQIEFNSLTCPVCDAPQYIAPPSHSGESRKPEEIATPDPATDPTTDKGQANASVEAEPYFPAEASHPEATPITPAPTPAHERSTHAQKLDTRKTEKAKKRSESHVRVWSFVAAVVLVMLGAAGWYWRGRAPENMSYVAGGTFTIGRSDGDEYEQPPHAVTLKPFYIDKFEVTCEEYKKFVDETDHPAPAEWINGKYPPGARLLPVTGVSWNDANAFAQWAKKRLPTEEEWEVAARGDDGRLYPWGREWNAGAANTAATALEKLVDVGTYSQGASPFGALDMVGNAWEWTSSSIHSYPGGKITEDDYPEAERSNMKVIRGGCYLSAPQDATATYRSGWPPREGGTYELIGFRCAMDAQP